MFVDRNKVHGGIITPEEQAMFCHSKFEMWNPQNFNIQWSAQLSRCLISIEVQTRSNSILKTKQKSLTLWVMGTESGRWGAVEINFQHWFGTFQRGSNSLVAELESVKSKNRICQKHNKLLQIRFCFGSFMSEDRSFLYFCEDFEKQAQLCSESALLCFVYHNLVSILVLDWFLVLFWLWSKY